MDKEVIRRILENDKSIEQKVFAFELYLSNEMAIKMNRIVERLEEEKKSLLDKVEKELDELYLEILRHYTHEANGIERAIEIIKTELN